MIRSTRIALCAAVAAGMGLGLASTFPQQRAQAEDMKDMKMEDKTKDKGHDTGMAEMKKMDIIDTAVGPGMQEVTTVVTAIKAADLVETLKGKGPFTVFAPTNAAFAKLPAGTVEDLLKPENKEKLKGILLYHVHAGDAIKAADVKTMSLTTANGKPLKVTAGSDGVMINDAKVIKTDVICTNGVIHWIDTVLLP